MITEPRVSLPALPLPPRPRLRLDYLDGLRGLAALLVVVYHICRAAFGSADSRPATHWMLHIAALKYGHYAVDVFIVLSGFCLMLPIAQRGDGKMSRSVADFFKRRARRILPPYYAALALSLLALLLVPAIRLHGGDEAAPYDRADMPGAILSHLLLVHNLNPHWVFRINVAMWSVATEWQIYFLFPLLLLPLWRRFGLLAPIAVGYLIGLPTIFLHLEGACLWYAGLFAMGMSGAALAFDPTMEAEKPRFWKGFGVTLLLLTPFALLCSRRGIHPLYDLVFGAATLYFLVYCAEHCRRGDESKNPAVLRLMSAPWTVALGQFSYSLYLVHIPLVAVMHVGLVALGVSRLMELGLLTVVGIPVILGFTYLFHLAFEKRFMNAPSAGRVAAVLGKNGTANLFVSSAGDQPPMEMPTERRPANPLAALRAKIGKKGFLGSILVMVSGAVLGQGIGVALSPVLSRLFTPTDFGMLAVFMSVSSTLLVAASLRYEMAIPLPEKDEDAVNVLALSLGIVLLTSLLTLGATLAFGHKIVHWTKTPGLAHFLWMLPFGLLCGGFYQALSFWTTRQRRFGILSSTKATQGAGMSAIQLGGGLLHAHFPLLAGFGPGSLIVGFVASNCLGAGSLLKRSALPLQSVSWAGMRAVAVKYRHFPYFTVWANLINVFGQQAPAVLFARYFTVATAGFFAMTTKMLGLPSFLIGQAVQQVFYPVANEVKDDPEKASELIEKTAASLLAISFGLFAMIFLHGPWLFTKILGARWHSAGEYAQILSPWFTFSFVSGALSGFALIKGKQGQALLMTLYETSLRMVGIGVGIHLGNPLMAVKLYSAAGTIIGLVYLGWILRLAGSGLLRFMYKVRGFLGAGFALVGLLWLLSRHLEAPHPLLSTLISLVCLGALTAWFGRSLISMKMKKPDSPTVAAPEAVSEEALSETYDPATNKTLIMERAAVQPEPVP